MSKLVSIFNSDLVLYLLIRCFVYVAYFVMIVYRIYLNIWIVVYCSLSGLNGPRGQWCLGLPCVGMYRCCMHPLGSLYIYHGGGFEYARRKAARLRGEIWVHAVEEIA